MMMKPDETKSSICDLQVGYQYLLKEMTVHLHICAPV